MFLGRSSLTDQQVSIHIQVQVSIQMHLSPVVNN